MSLVCLCLSYTAIKNQPIIIIVLSLRPLTTNVIRGEGYYVASGEKMLSSGAKLKALANEVCIILTA